MSKNVLDKKSSAWQKAATERLTLVGSVSAEYELGLPDLEATEQLSVPELDDGDATRQVRRPAFTLPHGVTVFQRIDGYEILDELGRGGMGVVYKAWQHSLQRTVALKMILAGSFAGPQELERFRAEAMAIARLHHPHLLNIFEIGESNQLPFYAMEYMDGGSLSRRLNGQPVSPRVAAALLRSLAQAMDYAHKNGIVHRDLKPANILLSGNDTVPLPACLAKIGDFGIAKHLHHNSSYTRTGDILGTPNYMAPEQAMGRTAQIGPAADVYSLGAILYELLTGRPPFEGPSGADVLLLLMKEDPERPSHWQRAIPRDLETICLKCLEKDPAKRYATAGALADDLERFLQNEPVQARPASLTDRAVKWTRRRPALAAILLMTSCLLLLSFGMMVMVMRQAVERAQLKDDMLTQSHVLLADAYLERGIYLAEKGDVRRGMHWMLRSLEMTEENDTKQNHTSDLAAIIRMNLSSWGQCVSSREVLLPHSDWVWDLAFSPDQKYVATASRDKRLQIWHAKTGQAVGAALEHPFAVWGVAFHPDGKTLFTICGDPKSDQAGLLCVWSAHPDRPGQFVPRGEPMRFCFPAFRMVLNPQGDRIWIGSYDGLACLLTYDADAADNGLQLLTELTPSFHDQPTFSLDGTLLASIVGKCVTQPPYFQASNQVQLWDGRTGKPLGEPLLHEGYVRTLLFTKNGRRLIVGNSTSHDLDQGETSYVQVWDIAQRKSVARSATLHGRAKASALASNGQLFAVSLFEYTRGPERIHVTDGRVLLWQMQDDGAIEPFGSPLRTGHVVWSLAFSPDSRMVLAGCENSGAYLWSVSNCQRLLAPIRHEGNCVKVAFSKDGRSALTASAGGGVTVSAKLWEVPVFGHIGPPLWQPSGIRSTFWEQDGTHVWVGCRQSLARWDHIRGVKCEETSMPGLVEYYHSTGDDRRFLADMGNERQLEYDRETKKMTELPRLGDPSERGYGFEYYRDAKVYLQFWSKPSRLRILDQDGKPITPRIAEAEFELLARRLSPHGDILVVSQTILQHTNRLVIYNAHDLSVRRVLPVKHSIHSLAFSPDGKTLAFGGRDRQVQRYDIETGEFVGSPLLHEGVVHWMSYVGNDRLLATSSENGLILLWDVKTGKRVGPAFENHSDLMSIGVHPQGKYILTATPGKLAMAWRIPEPMPGSLTSIKAWVEAMTGMEMNAQDTIVPIDSDLLQERRQRLAANQ